MFGQCGGLDQTGGADRERLRQRLVERQRGIAAALPALVLGVQMAGVVAGQEREHRAPFVGDLAAEDRGHRALAVEIDHQHPVAVECGRHRQMCRGRGLADAALEIRHREDLRRQPGRPPGQIVALRRLAALAAEEAAQAQHLVEGEPFRPGLGFGMALRQLGVGLQHPAQMALGDGDQVAADLPGREAPQMACVPGVEAAARQVLAAGGAGAGEGGKLRRADRLAEARGGPVGVDAEIGGLHCSGPHVRCFCQNTENALHGRKFATCARRLQLFLADSPHFHRAPMAIGRSAGGFAGCGAVNDR